MPVGEFGSLGFAAAAALVLLIITLAARRRWRLAAARRVEVARLAQLAAREAAEAEAEMEALALGHATAGYSFGPGSGYDYVAATNVVERPQHCEVCHRPTSTRCSRCKAVKYCSGKCQIIHWRQGHKDACHPPRLDDSHDGEGSVYESRQAQTEGTNLNTDSLKNEEKLHPELVETSGSPSEPNISSVVVPEDDKLKVKAFESTFATEGTLDPFTTSSPSSRTTVFGPKGTSEGTKASKDLPPLHNARRESDGMSSDNIGKAVKRNEEIIEASPEFPSERLSVNGDSSRNTRKHKTCEIKVSATGSTGYSGSSFSGICENSKPSEDTAECLEAIPETNVAERANNTTNSEILHGSDRIQSDARCLSKPSNLSSKSLPSNTRLREENSPKEAVLLDSQAQSRRIARDLGCDKSVSAVCGIKDNASLLNSEGPRSLSSNFTANHVCSSDEMHPTLSDAHLKVHNASPALANSFNRRGSLPNGVDHLKISVTRAVQQFKSSNYSRQYTSEFENDIFGKYKMLFPYDLFIKLYNCDKVELRPFGLQNCGNSCYANAVLQCLAFTRPITAYLLQGQHTKTCPKRMWCFTCELENLLLKAKEGKSPLSPMGILSHIDDIGSHLGRGREEDAHEFLRHVIDTMQSACLKEARVSINDPLATETTLIQLTFGGYLRSKIKCMKCHGKSMRNERMLDLTVEIHGDIKTLEEALRRFTASEVLDGDNKYHCNRCKTYERAKKKLTVLEAPNILTVALKRFQSGEFGKLNKAVRFPEYLNLAPYMSGTDDKSPVYQLYAVVVHRDAMNATFSGHYICYVKSTQGRWYKINDSLVKPVELEKVLRKTAYMLFYARCSPRGPNSLRKAMMSHVQRRVRKSRGKGSFSGCSEGSSSSSTRSSPIFLRPFGASDLFDAMFKSPNMDTSSDSSLLSCSDEGSCSTDSTRDSTSTEFSDYKFGDSGRFALYNPSRFAEDSDGSTLASSHSSEAVLNYEEDHVVVDGAVDLQSLGTTLSEGNDDPSILYSDTANHHCRESLTKLGSSRQADWVNPHEMKSSVLTRRPTRERTALTFR